MTNIHETSESVGLLLTQFKDVDRVSLLKTLLEQLLNIENYYSVIFSVFDQEISTDLLQILTKLLVKCFNVYHSEGDCDLFCLFPEIHEIVSSQ